MNNKKVEMYKNIILLTQVGLVIISSIGITLYIGNAIDNWLNTGNAFKIVFLLLGVVSGLYSAYRLLQKGFKK